jgi:filamentous hemagglutinin
LLVAPGFFRKGGFSDYTLSSSGKTLDIAPGTQLAPAAEGLAVKLSSLARRAGATSSGLGQSPANGGDAGIPVTVAGGSGSDAVAAELTIREKVAGERAATDTHFKMVKGASEAQVLSLGEGAEINADPGATVEFAGSGMNSGSTMNILGRVRAAGGNIVASWGTNELAGGVAGFDPAHPDADTQSGLIHVGAKADLDTSGEFIQLGAAGGAVGPVREADGSVTRRARRQGYVSSGGSISLKATNGRVVTEQSSVLNVSAASATVDLPTNASGGPYAAKAIWGDAGSIAISSTEASRLDGRLKANAAGNGLGGSFSQSFVRHDVGNIDTQRTDFAHRIVVSQAKPDSDERIVTGSERYVTSRIAADTLNAGGFANVTLKSDNSIEFTGPVQLAAVQGLTLDAPILDVRGTVSVPAPKVQLAADHLTLTNTAGGNPWAYRVYGGQTATTPVPMTATRAGEGMLVGKARLIDLMGSVTVNGVRGGTDVATGEEARGLVLDSRGDIRLTGLAVKQGTDATQTVDALVGRLTTEGNIELRGQQVYTTTMSDYTVASQRVTDANPAQPGRNQTVTNSGTVRISRNAGAAQAVLSAASKLTLKGDRIVQAGTLRAPAGRIELAAREVNLEPDSVTSVSLDGLTVPLGKTSNGTSWEYNLGGYSMPLSSPGEMQVVVDGADVHVKPGATIDLSGGGDVQAFEFLAGPGGSKDVLQTSASAPTWAVLASTRLTDAPVDTDLAARNGSPVAGKAGYNTIYISGVAGLADGWYPLLDGHYALLPGGYQVSALTAANRSQLLGAAATTYKNQLAGSSYGKQLEALANGAYSGTNLPLGQDVPVGKVGTLIDGTTVIAAQRGVAGTGIQEARSSGYLVRSGREARRYSEYALTTSEFFARQATANDRVAPRLPTDAGGLTLKPTGDLSFAGKLLAKPKAGGKAAEIDISADLLAVVTETGDAATEQALASELTGLPTGAKFVEIGADSLAGLEGSVLLGGSRSADGTLTTGARRVVVATSAAKPLSAAEVMLAARDQVTVLTGAVVQADLPGTTARNAYTTTGDGALLRASSDGQLTLDRSNTSMATGNLDIRAGATVKGTSILADATGTNRIDGTLQVGKLQNGTRSGGSLGMAAKSVALGETAGYDARGGLVMDNAKLATLNSLDELAIRSYSSIDLVGNARAGAAGVLQRLTLDAREIAGYQAPGSATANQATIAAPARWPSTPIVWCSARAKRASAASARSSSPPIRNWRRAARAA